MRRAKNVYPHIKAIKPIIFWKECRFCGDEFVREPGFAIEDYTAVNPRIYWSYCCSSCAGSEEEVKRLVEKSKLIVPPRHLKDKNIKGELICKSV